MGEQPTTQPLGSTTVVFGWVEQARVEQVLHASDGFQLMLGISLTGFGGTVADVVALAAGALHPTALYLILCVLGTATLLTGAFAGREFVRYRKVRGQLTAATAKVPVPILLVTPGQSSSSVSGQAVGDSAPLVQDVHQVQQNNAADSDTNAMIEYRSSTGGSGRKATAPQGQGDAKPLGRVKDQPKPIPSRIK